MSSPKHEPEQKLAVAPTQTYDHKGAGPGELDETDEGMGARWEAGLVGQQAGKYRIVRPLGSGGMGVVFEAVHESIGQRAAVKVLRPRLSADPLLCKRFFTEARAVIIAQHAGLVKIFDHGKLPGGALYILMEYLEGESLHGRLDRLGRLAAADALRLGRQIASALAAAHDRGIVHRDLKPANVFIVPDPEAPSGERAKILDFGLAKIIAAQGPAEGAQGAASSGGSTSSTGTGTGTIMGTPVYMAPEQCRGLGQADGQADVYALGVMLYEMLAGRPPFVSQAAGDLIAMHILQQPRPLREVSPGISPAACALVQKMLAKEPEQRPTMIEVSTALARLATLQGIDDALGPPRSGRWGRYGVGAGSAGLLLLGLLWVWQVQQDRRAPDQAGRQGPQLPAVVVPRADAARASSFQGGVTASAPGPARQPALFTCVLGSEPAGAEVVRTGTEVVLGVTPFRTELSEAGPGLDLTVRHAGHASQRVVLEGGAACTRTVTLAGLPGKVSRRGRPGPVPPAREAAAPGVASTPPAGPDLAAEDDDADVPVLR